MSPREIRICLTKTWNDPYYVIVNRSCHTPEFCYEFIDQFNEITFDRPDQSLERAFVVRKLAELTRDSHLVSKSFSVLATAYRTEGLPAPKVDSLIAMALDLAADCPRCLAEALRRKGIIYLYRKEFQEGCRHLSSAIDYSKEVGNNDGVARALISRGVGFYSLGHIDEAILDEERALELLSVRSPSRYYISILINVAAILILAKEQDRPKKERMLDDTLEILDRLAEILKGQKRRHERVRVIMRWIRGLIHAAKGERRTAFRLLFSARSGIERLGMRAEILAISADLAKLYKLSPRDNDDQVILLAERCLRAYPDWDGRGILHRLQRTPDVGVIEEMRRATGCRIPSLL
jgi:tetratricopeptide (TPR) repeat protein